MFEVIHAKHRKDYFRLAFKHWTSPQHVWALAHGEHSDSPKDKEILHDLVDLGIIHRHKRKKYYGESSETVE